MPNESVGKHFGNMSEAEIDALLGPLFDSLPQSPLSELLTVDEAFN